MNIEQPTTLQAWLNYLGSLDPQHIELGLNRVRSVADKMGLLSFDCPVVTVAGTNGKGSTIALLQAIYQAAGFCVGCYTSPHLNAYEERIQIAGIPVTAAQLCAAFASIDAAQSAIKLTYFEWATLAALSIFKKSQLDLIILEVGLGGRLDAVNIIDADVAVITSIGLDHCEYLGDTREQIALEKAGICRPHKPAVCGDLDPPHTLLAYVKAQHIPCYFANRDFKLQTNQSNWQWQWNDKQYSKLTPTKLGMDNASTALMVVLLLQPSLAVTPQALNQGLKRADCPARWQRLEAKTDTYIDVCHNPAAAQYLAKRVARLSVAGKIYAICGMQAHKDIKGTLQPLLSYVDQWVATDIDISSGASAQLIQHMLQQWGVCSVLTCNSPQEAYESLLNISTAEDVIIIFGSFYTVAPFVPT